VLIIVEGTDLAGKSSLVRDLTRRAMNLNVRVTAIHAGPPGLFVDPLDEYELALLPLRNAALDPGQLVLIDRWHLGELVYGPLLRGHSRLSAAQFEHIERFLDALGAVRIIIEPEGEDALRARYAARGDELLTLDQVLEVRRWFHQAAATYHWRLVTSPASDRVLTDLLVWAEVACVRVQCLLPFPGYVGSSTPILLLVGDEPNGHVPGTQPNPAFLPIGKNSGHYLIDSLLLGSNSIMRSSGQWGLANANDGTDVWALWDLLARPRVVALGNRCYATLSELKIPATPARHPQWVRRFQHARQAAYGHELLHADTVSAA
jgi:thymidylate kinase